MTPAAVTLYVDTTNGLYYVPDIHIIPGKGYFTDMYMYVPVHTCTCTVHVCEARLCLGWLGFSC